MSRNTLSFPERWYAASNPPRTRMVICRREGFVVRSEAAEQTRRLATHLKVVELVVDVKAEVFDPFPGAIELVREAHDEERVKRVDDEAVRGSKTSKICLTQV